MIISKPDIPGHFGHFTFAVTRPCRAFAIKRSSYLYGGVARFCADSRSARHSLRAFPSKTAIFRFELSDFTLRGRCAFLRRFAQRATYDLSRIPARERESKLIVRLRRNLRDRVALALVAIVGREAELVFREIGQRFVDREGVEDQEIAELKIARYPVG